MDANLFSWVSDTLLVGAIALAAAWWGVRSQRRIAKQRATFDWVITIAEQEGRMEPHSKAFADLAGRSGGLVTRAEPSHSSTPETHSIRLILNMYEGYAIGLSSGAMDYEVYRRLMSSATLIYWGAAQAFVYRLREVKGNESLYIEFEVLADKLAETGKFPKNYLEGDLLTRFWKRQHARLEVAQTKSQKFSDFYHGPDV